MDFADAERIVKDVPGPHIPPRRGRILYRHIRRNRPDQVLELGTARAGSAVFIAAALEANGVGHLTSVESLRWMRTDPTPHEVLAAAGLGEWVTLDASFSTYTWFLKSQIQKNLTPTGSVQPVYDLIFLDGAKNWSTDGLAVVLMEKLLKPGGWLLLDDLGWSYGKNVKGTAHYGVEIGRLSEQERTEPHLRAIFELLIKTNPAYDEYIIQDDWWGWARKSCDASRHVGGVLSGTGPHAKAASKNRSSVLRRVWRRLSPATQRRIRTLQRKIASTPADTLRRWRSGGSN